MSISISYYGIVLIVFFLLRLLSVLFTRPTFDPGQEVYCHSWGDRAQHIASDAHGWSTIRLGLETREVLTEHLTEVGTSRADCLYLASWLWLAAGSLWLLINER